MRIRVWLSGVVCFSFVACQSPKAIEPSSSFIRTSEVPGTLGGVSPEREFVYENGDCVVTWTLHTKRNAAKEKFLTLRDACPGGSPFAVYAQLLRAVTQAEPGAVISSATLNGWHQHAPMSEAMALECLDAPEWKEFRKQRKARQLMDGNDAFVKIFNRADLGRDLKRVFAGYGYSIELERVEKVFESPANQLAFAAKHPKLAATSRGVAYSAGVYEFKIAKIPK